MKFLKIFLLFSFCFFLLIAIANSDINCPGSGEEITPVTGTLTIYNMGLANETNPTEKGQSILVVGPTGITALIDVAKTSSDRTIIVNTVKSVNQIYGRDTYNEVDYVIITHMHNDHMGNFNTLFNGTPGGLTVSDSVPGYTYSGKVVWRGFFDEQSNTSDWKPMCDLLKTDYPASKKFRLCNGPEPSDCNVDKQNPHYATNCNSLNVGNIQNQQTGLTTFIDLGTYNGVPARIYIYGVNRKIRKANEIITTTVTQGQPILENDLSMVGVIKYGNFRYSFGGDLTDEEEDDIVNNLGDIRVGDTNSEQIIPNCIGVDVYLAHHHGRNTSSSKQFLDNILCDTSFYTSTPKNSKQAIVPLKEGYSKAPEHEAIWRILGFSESQDCSTIDNVKDTSPRLSPGSVSPFTGPTTGRLWFTRDGGNTYDGCIPNQGKYEYKYYDYIKRAKKSGSAGHTIIQTEIPPQDGTVKQYITKYYTVYSGGTKEFCIETDTVVQD